MANSQNPLFYSNPVPIQKELHKKAGLSKEINYKFAKKTNSLPININEFHNVSKYYPIVFTGDDASFPVAVLGLEDSINYYVNAKGEWEKNTYIPAYARRYPFIFTANAEKLILCIDSSSDRFQPQPNSKADTFFNDNNPTELITSALNFCTEYHSNQIETTKFSEAIKNAGLLVDRQLNVLPNKKESTKVLGGFKIIDEEKLRKIDEKIIVEWHKNGYLALIYMHLLSSDNWQALTQKSEK